MRLCFEKIELDGQDAVFFQNVMNALFETRHESECRARLEEARVWFDKWRLLETHEPRVGVGASLDVAGNCGKQRCRDLYDE
jgi:hypothetical protein